MNAFFCNFKLLSPEEERAKRKEEEKKKKEELSMLFKPVITQTVAKGIFKIYIQFENFKLKTKYYSIFALIFFLILEILFYFFHIFS